MGRLGEKAVRSIAKHQLDPKSDAARASAYPAGEVDKEGMLLVHSDTGLLQLFLQPEGGYRVA